MAGPLLAPGHLLLRDAVATPRSHLTDAALGLSDAAPRALPQDFAVAVGSHVVDGGILVTALLVTGLWLAGWGAARLAAVVLPEAGPAGGAVATTLAVWNPYVAERLLQGHWSLLVGYGCLPWVAAAVLRRRDGHGSWWPPAFWLALAGLTPTGLMLAATVALAAGCARGVRSWRVPAGTLGLALLVAAPWLVASALGGSLSGTPETGVAAFAARAEPGLATVGSLAGLGGIWNVDAVPPSRTTAFAVVATLVLLAVVAAGLPAAVRRPAAVPLLALAAVAVVVPALMATGPGLAAVDAVVRALPGLGVVRDGQKWVALAMPGYALAGAGAVLTLRRWLPAAAVAAVCSAALIAVLPDLAWGVGGRMTAVTYPAGWRAVATMIDADPRPVAVLPPDSMRSFAWAGPAPVLDPLPRWVRADVLSTGDLVIGGTTIPGEGARARDVQALLLGGASRDELAAAGVGWVVVESGDARLALPEAYRDGDLTVYRVGGSAPASPHRALMIGVHLVWVAVLVGGAVGAVLTRRRVSAASAGPSAGPSAEPSGPRRAG